MTSTSASEGPVHNVVIHPDPLVSVMRSRFGVRVPGAAFAMPIPADAISSEEVQRVFGTKGDDGMNDDDWAAMRVVAICCLDAQCQSIPSEVCDLSPSIDRFHPLHGTNFHFTLRKVSPRTWVLDSVVADDVRWLCVVEDPVTLMEIARSGYGPTKADLARSLCRRGLAFRTVLPGLPRWPLPPPRRVGLGVMPHGTMPTLDDYESYERLRRDFLRGPGGVAALKKGGVVWRLAMEEVDPEDIVFGPRGGTLASFQVEWDGASAVDDDLTPQELDLICGVHHVLNSA